MSENSASAYGCMGCSYCLSELAISAISPGYMTEMQSARVYHGQVVRDEQVSQAHLCQLFEKPDQLGLNVSPHV